MTTTVLNAKISKVEYQIIGNSKYITTQEFNKLTTENLTIRLKQAGLVNESGFDNKLKNFNKKMTLNKIKHSEVPKRLNSLITNLIFWYISDGFSATESREVSLNGYTYDFSVDYNSVEKSDMLNIYMYLMTKNNMKNSYYVLLNL